MLEDPRGLKKVKKFPLDKEKKVFPQRTVNVNVFSLAGFEFH